MPPRPGILDGLSRSDELLVDIAKTLENLHAHLSREEERETRIVYFAYPNDGTLATLQAGTTTFDFKVGAIEDVDEVITRMSHSLQSEGRGWLRSFFVNSDKSITVQPDGYDRIPATEEKDALGTYQEFTKLQIICTEETKIFVVCCTSPEAVVRLISNTSVLADPIDIFGHRTYIGAGELANRLGALQTFDKRGSVTFFDDFENNIGMWDLDESQGGTIRKSIDTAMKKNFSLKFITSSAGKRALRLYYHRYPPVKKKIGTEYSFSIGNITDLYNDFRLYDGTKQYEAAAYYMPDSNGGELFVLGPDSGSDYRSIAQNLALEKTGVSSYTWHTWKIVADTKNEKNVRIILDGASYDTSDYDMYVVDDTSKKEFEFHLTLWGNASSVSYIDNFILTENEP